MDPRNRTDVLAGDTFAVSGFPGKCLQNAVSGFPGKCLQNASARTRVLLCITGNRQLDIVVIRQGLCLKVSFSDVSNRNVNIERR